MTEQEFTKTYLATFTPQQLAAVKAVEERSDSITKTATIRFDGMTATKKLALPGSVEKGYLVIGE